MTNLNTLETFRTKAELLNYFEKKGQRVTEEEIVTLKKSYKETEENSKALTLKQLSDIAGGVIFELKNTGFFSKLFGKEPCLVHVPGTKNQPGIKIMFEGTEYDLNQKQMATVIKGYGITEHNLPQELEEYKYVIHETVCEFYGINPMEFSSHNITHIENLHNSSVIHYTIEGGDPNGYVLFPGGGRFTITGKHDASDTYFLSNEHGQHFVLRQGILFNQTVEHNGISHFVSQDGNGREIYVHNNIAYNEHVTIDGLEVYKNGRQSIAIHDGTVYRHSQFGNCHILNNDGQSIALLNGRVYDQHLQFGDLHIYNSAEQSISLFKNNVYQYSQVGEKGEIHVLTTAEGRRALDVYVHDKTAYCCYRGVIDGKRVFYNQSDDNIFVIGADNTVTQLTKVVREISVVCGTVGFIAEDAQKNLYAILNGKLFDNVEKIIESHSESATLYKFGPYCTYRGYLANTVTGRSDPGFDSSVLRRMVTI